MTLRLTGRTLDREGVIRVARQAEPVVLDDEARTRMRRSRSTVASALARGDRIYGLTTAVGVLKRVAIGADGAGPYSNQMLRFHTVGQGPDAPPELVRATLLRLANHFAEGSTGVRPLLAEVLVECLNNGRLPRIRSLGSIGQADLAPLADLAVGVFSDVELEPGEGLALLGNNAFSTAWAALAVNDATALIDVLEIAGALSLEGLAAVPAMLHPAIGRVRPYPGLQRSLARLGWLLEGSDLWLLADPPQLQDPLTFRTLPQVLGACRDALAHVDGVLAIELNASQGNPIVLDDEERVISVANFDVLPLAAALDYLRIVLASVLSASAERSVKLLQAPVTGLATGLAARAGTLDPGLTYLGIAVQALAAEARLLAGPVSFELTSTSHAEGVEDRATMAPLGARRLADAVDLGRRIAAIELTVAAQAVDVRGMRSGAGTGRAQAAIRAWVPFLVAGDPVPDVEPLVAAIADGRLIAAVGDPGPDRVAAAAGRPGVAAAAVPPVPALAGGSDVDRP
ncbi:MAG: aromatic amino acid lyase [Candidatus Limnocylindrales bacterium]